MGIHDLPVIGGGGEGGSGAPGPPGPPGPPGASSSAYTFTFSTAATAPPGTGEVRSDGATAATSTVLYLSYRQSVGGDIAPLLRAITAGDVLTLQDRTDSTLYAELEVSGDAVDHPAQSYVEVPISLVAATGQAKNNQAVTVFHQMSGAQGPPGPKGADGAPGPKGADGAPGPKGDKGDPGADSTIPGPAGSKGDAGPAGPASTVPGPAGATGPAGPAGPAGPSTASLPFVMPVGTGSVPASGQLTTESSFGVTAKLFISNTTKDGTNIAPMLAALKSGDILTLQDVGTPANSFTWHLTGPTVNQGTYFDVPVAKDGSTGALSNTGQTGGLAILKGGQAGANGAPGVTAGLTYRLPVGTGDVPASGQVTTESAFPVTARLFINYTSSGGINSAAALRALKSGDVISLQDTVSGASITWHVSGAVQDFSGSSYVNVPVVKDAAQGTLGNTGQLGSLVMAIPGPAGPAGPAGASASALQFVLPVGTGSVPTSGQLTTESAFPVTARLFINYRTKDGADVSAMLRTLAVGDSLTLQDASASITWHVSGAAADLTTYFNVPVAKDSSSGTLGNTGQTGTLSIAKPGPPGPKGDPGAVGATGPAGPAGPAGAKGADSTVAGPAGPAGPSGSAGPKGDPGPAGADGADGTDGAVGPAGMPGGALRQAATATVTSVVNAGQKRTTVDLAPSYLIAAISTTVPARVRLYPSNAAATADLNRPVDQEPDASSELAMEYVTQTGKLSSTISPLVGGAQVPSTPTVYLSIENLSGATSDVSVTFTYLALEAA